MRSKIVSLVCWFLTKSTLSTVDRNRLLNTVFDKLALIQSEDIIKLGVNGALTINSNPVEYEQARLLKESARSMIHSTARSIVRKQVEYLAVTYGIHRAESPEQMLFAKAAIWWSQEEEKLYQMLAGEDQSL